MRVLHLYSGNLYGGIETLLVTLARQRELCPEMEPHFGLCFDGQLSRELTASADTHLLPSVRFRRPWTIWQARRRLRRVFDQFNCDVAVCHGCWAHAVFAPVARARRLPLVFWAHDVHLGRHWLERLAAQCRPDLVIANSRFTQSMLSNLFPGVNSQVVYLPVAPPADFDQKLIRAGKRAELRTHEKCAVIVLASRLERWKGHELLIHALARIRHRRDWICWIAGGPQRSHELAYLHDLKVSAEMAGISDRIRFLGQRNDVRKLFAAADIHCQPNSGPEPFGIAFIEALYAGLPIVTTVMGAVPEIVDESCGVLVPPNAEAIAGALVQLLDDPHRRKQLGESGPDRARSLCSPARQLKCLHETLSGLIDAAVEPPLKHGDLPALQLHGR